MKLDSYWLDTAPAFAQGADLASVVLLEAGYLVGEVGAFYRMQDILH